MPRAQTSTTEEDVKPKRAPRRRVAAATEGETKVKRAPRKRVSSKKTVVASTTTDEEARSESRVGEVVERKAPTRLRLPTSATSRRGLYVSLSVLTLGLVGSVFIGLSDAGQIDTAAVISDRNERIISGQETQMEDKNGNIVPVKVVVPVQNTNSAPNGGLVPMAPSGQPTSAPVTAPVEMASTTEEVVASSTATTTDELSVTTESAMMSGEVLDSEADVTTTDTAGTEPAPSEDEEAGEVIE